MRIVRTEYKNKWDHPVVYVFIRDADGKRCINEDHGLRPYFYISVEELGIAVTRGFELDESRTYRASTGEELYRVYTQLPKDVVVQRNEFDRTWEADIMFPTRYMIDRVHELTPTKPMICYIDIEVHTTGYLFPDVSKALDPINAITIGDNYSGDLVTWAYRFPGHAKKEPKVSFDILKNDMVWQIREFGTEDQMMENFIEYFANYLQPDILTGWNSSGFDMPYLVNRLYQLGINPNILSPIRSTYIRPDTSTAVIKGIADLDLLAIYRKINQQQEESYRLDFIAKKNLGEGKASFQGDLNDLWKDDFDKFVEYNAQDTRLVMLLDRKLGLINFMDELRRTCFCQYEDTLSAARTTDAYVLKYFHNRKVFPTKDHDNIAPDFEGAFVGNWSDGLHNNIAVFDLASLYPSIMISANLSPETVRNIDDFIDDLDSIEDTILVNGLTIEREPQGFLPEIASSLFGLRKHYKDLMQAEDYNSDFWKMFNNQQDAVKRILNSLYGQTSFAGGRLFEPRVAEAITYLGRRIIHHSREFIESRGYKVIYSDTDSVFIECGDIVDHDAMNVLLGDLDASYDVLMRKFGIESHIITMEWEKIYTRIIFAKAKKRYAGWLTWKDGKPVDSVDVTGFETKRSDSPSFSRDLQKQVFELLLRQGAEKEEIIEFITGEAERLRVGDFEWDEIGIPKGISKPVSEYGRWVPDKLTGKPKRVAVPANIRAMEYSLEHLRIALTGKPKFVYIASVPAGFPRTDVLAFDEGWQIPDGFELDIYKMLDKLVKDRLNSIMDALGWKPWELGWWWRNARRGRKKFVVPPEQMALAL